MSRKLKPSITGSARFIIITGIIGFMWWFFRSYILFVALFLFVFSAVISVYFLHKSRDKFKVELSLPASNIGKNVQVPFHIIMQNPLRFAGFIADVEYHFGNSFTAYNEICREHVWIAPSQGLNITKKIAGSFLGQIYTMIDRIRIYDLFHLFYIEGNTADAYVTVFPNIEKETGEEIKSIVDNFPGDSEIKKRGNDLNPDYEIREYIPGDALKNIHWKLTAKQNRVMVKERTSSGREKIHLLLRLENKKEENDKLIESLHELGQTLINKEYPVQVSYSASNGELITGYATESGEFDGIIEEILSMCGLRDNDNAQQEMLLQFPGQPYILIQTGKYKGAYIT